MGSGLFTCLGDVFKDCITSGRHLCEGPIAHEELDTAA